MRNPLYARAVAAALVPVLAVPVVGAATATPTSATVRATAAVGVATTQPTQRERLLYITNAERARHGLPPLALREGVELVAREWSATMARDQRLRHRPDLATRLAERGVTGWRAVGENVGRAQSVDRVHELFMQSSAHRANLLSTQYSEIGIGVTERDGTMWVAVDFVGY